MLAQEQVTRQGFLLTTLKILAEIIMTEAASQPLSERQTLALHTITASYGEMWVKEQITTLTQKLKERTKLIQEAQELEKNEREARGLEDQQLQASNPEFFADGLDRRQTPADLKKRAKSEKISQKMFKRYSNTTGVPVSGQDRQKKYKDKIREKKRLNEQVKLGKEINEAANQSKPKVEGKKPHMRDDSESSWTFSSESESKGKGVPGDKRPHP